MSSGELLILVSGVVASLTTAIIAIMNARRCKDAVVTLAKKITRPRRRKDADL